MASELSVRRTLQNKSRFLTDMFAPNMLYGLTIRSRTPCTTIVDIKAPDLPRDIFLLKAADIPGVNRVEVLGDVAPILAEHEARYCGEPVAILVGPSPTQLVELAGAIEIVGEACPAMLDPWNGEGRRLIVERTRERGNITKALRAADRQVEGSYITGIQDHLYSEPLGAYAVRDDRGIVTVFSSSQWPYHVRQTVAAAVGVAEDLCRVRSTEVGVHLDGKVWYPSVVAAHAAIAAIHTGKPVKLIYTREEDFRFSPKGMNVKVACVTGLDDQGAVTVADIDATVNLGAYPLFTDEILSRVATALVSQYRCETIRLRIRAVSTNLPPLNACGGLGTSHAIFAMETHASRLSEVTGIPPVDWKQKNILRRGDRPLIGDPLTADLDQHGLISRVAKESDFERKFAAFELQKKSRTSFGDLLDSPRGIGIAFGHQASGFLGRTEEAVESEIRVRLEKAGTAELFCGAVTDSDSMRSIWKQNLTTVLNVPESDIRLHEPDTAHSTDCGPAILSRNMTIVQRTIETACNAIKKKRFRTPLPIEVTRNSRPARGVTWDPITFNGQPFGPLSCIATVVEVEVNPASYETQIRGVWMAVDAGRILLRDQAKRVLERGVFHALSWAGVEELLFTDGELGKADYHRYQHSRMVSIAPIWIEFLGDTEKAVPRGLGDLPLACIPAAFAAAVTQATGRYIDRIPCTSETLQMYLEDT